jgi:hypothetical protein
MLDKVPLEVLRMIVHKVRVATWDKPLQSAILGADGIGC